MSSWMGVSWRAQQQAGGTEVNLRGRRRRGPRALRSRTWAQVGGVGRLVAGCAVEEGGGHGKLGVRLWVGGDRAHKGVSHSLTCSCHVVLFCDVAGVWQVYAD